MGCSPFWLHGIYKKAEEQGFVSRLVQDKHDQVNWPAKIFKITEAEAAERDESSDPGQGHRAFPGRRQKLEKDIQSHLSENGPNERRSKVNNAPSFLPQANKSWSAKTKYPNYAI